MNGALPESVPDKVLLLDGVLRSGLGQVDEAALAGVALVPVDEDVGPSHHHPPLLPHLKQDHFELFNLSMKLIG